MRKSIALETRCTWCLALCGLCAWLSGCSHEGPSADRPWALILAEAPTREVARRKAEILSGQNPALEGASGLSIRTAEGSIRHLVVSRGQAGRGAAEHLFESLGAERPLRLKVFDFRTVEKVEGEEVTSASPPEETEEFERLARLLPPPGDDRLQSFLILWEPGWRGAKAPHPSGRTAGVVFSLAFGALGWQSTAEASYRAGKDGKGVLHVFIGRLGPDGSEERDAIRDVFNFLQPYVRPEQPAEEQTRDSVGTKKKRKKKKKKKTRKRRKRRVRRKKRKVPEPEVQLVPVVKDPPAPVEMQMPWGRTGVHVVERVALRKSARSGPATPLYTAWIAWTPGREAVMLALFDDRALAERLFTPCVLGEPTGLTHSSWVNAIWSALPEVTLEGERFEFLAMQRLGAWLPPKVRRAGWARRNAGLAVLMAGYRSQQSGGGRWQMNWFRPGDGAAAEQAYEKGLVLPRQALMQKVLKAKRAVSYEVGVTRREAGDVHAWHLIGADKGRIQELYFKRGLLVWLIRAKVESRGGLSTDDLLSRVELFQLWDTPAD